MPAPIAPIGDDDDSVDQLVATNGVNPRTGRYALGTLTPKLLSGLAEGRSFTEQEKAEIAAALHKGLLHLGVGYDITDANALDQTGWGIVFSADDPRVNEKKESLQRLLDHRRTEAGALYREFSGADGLQVNESGRGFLARFGDAAGPVAVEKVPYYLLLAGSPSEISFGVQTELDSRHAIGRVDFDDLTSLERYANALVAREEAKQVMATRAAFFATANPADQNTSRSAKRLATPLADTLTKKRTKWNVDRHFRDSATKAALVSLLNGPTPPSLLFTASHGLALDATDATQRERQGALVTQEWPGPLTVDREMLADEYFAASDVADTANLNGLIALMFACFGAGTPQYDEFLPMADNSLLPLSNTPFVARLCERLLLAGAGAVVGHVERAWSSSFSRPGAGTQIRAFEEAVLKLADGWRVGAAVDVLHTKCNEIANELINALNERKYGLMNDDEVAALFLARTDAANYVVIGDPAARLAV